MTRERNVDEATEKLLTLCMARSPRDGWTRGTGSPDHGPESSEESGGTAREAHQQGC